jgi:CRP/FNR family transcriptional regulator
MSFEQDFPIWGRLTAEEGANLVRSATLHKAAAGTILHDGSTDCVGVFVISAGQLKAYVRSEEGKQVTVWRLLDGDVCLMSAPCMIRDAQFDLTIEAERDTTLWIIPTATWHGLMESSAAVATYTSQVMASRLSDTIWLVEQVLWRRFDERLAGFLVQESLFEDSDTLRITHEGIASHMGSAREVVTRMLRYFQQEGLVELSRGSVRILDKNRPRALVSPS